MTSIPAHQNPVTSIEGLRPVNLGTDLAPLADLMELVFANSMDQGGRAAVREMRTLGQLGASFLAGVNELTLGINMGYVWIADGRLVGNVSIYPARGFQRKTWIIANVGVHPDFRRQGIAHSLMEASMELIRQRGGEQAILQVDVDNAAAQALYTGLGFVSERSWILWRRSTSLRPPLPSETSLHITHRRAGDWQAEYTLAQRLRPQSKGGLGWQRPLDTRQFRKPILEQMTDWLNMRSVERLVIRSEDETQLLAAMWIERGFLGSNTHLTLLVEPEYQGDYDEVLINTAARRFSGRSQALMIEHPADETRTSEVLRDYAFRPQREVTHMRWDIR